MKNKMLNLLATPFILLAAAAALADIPTIDSTTINGDYEIEFTTGDHVFHDFMQIKEVSSTQLGGQFEGTMTVPNAFTSPITGSYQTRIQWSGTSMLFNFSIVANESNQSYKVYYKGSINPTDYENFVNGTAQPTITGDVFVDGETPTTPLKKIGTFKAVRHAK